MNQVSGEREEPHANHVSFPPFLLTFLPSLFLSSVSHRFLFLCRRTCSQGQRGNRLSKSRYWDSSKQELNDRAEYWKSEVMRQCFCMCWYEEFGAAGVGRLKTRWARRRSGTWGFIPQSWHIPSGQPSLDHSNWSCEGICRKGRRPSPP